MSCSRRTSTPSPTCVNSTGDQSSRPGSLESRSTRRWHGRDGAGRYMTMDPENPPTNDFPHARDATPDPERLAIARELGALMESAIDRLPDGTREVFVLRQLEGMRTDEVAEALSVSDAVVKTRLSRARVALRRDLFEHAGLAAADTFRFLRPRCDRVVQAVLARIR